jgi:peptidoglycan/xylan/chitin deacetylase (PgdA/CDA1 family)
MPLKRLMKRAALVAGRLSSGRNLSTRRVVFCYHSVHPNRPYPSSKPETFERHVQWLKEHCRVASLVELVTDPRASVSGKPVVAITFDDGHEDNHSIALPILTKHGVTATFFITAGFVERDAAVLHRFQHLLGCGPDDLVPLDWEQIRELRASGMDIGCHTFSHPNLARLSAAAAAKELRTSRDLISERLGERIDLFAYPFGKPKVHFTAVTTEVVRDIGYRVAVAVTFKGVRESDSFFNVPRFFADDDDVAKLAAKIAGSYELVGWWQRHAPVSLLRIVSPDDFKR